DGRRLRLWGLAVPTPGTPCADDGGEPYACEAEARVLLTEEITRAREALEFLAGQIHRQYAEAPSLRCEVLGRDDDGVDLARCRTLNPSCIPQQVECADHWVDLAEQVIGSGSGAQRREQTAGAYDEAEFVACFADLGVWGVADGAGVARREGHVADCSA
ncbi:hypothetical protein, partial [Brevundimonas sp.]|uniref:hypothetical protein n=1 Tax=Brevundimonas sp. TaxID=1871086 RepID=UPI0025D5C369